ncbi:hypothetical protein M8A51_25640 [Schlegelella sp. S2-27]|uniref:Uncharacterized protein n=1 Tax=Caldimonas mangrovi TaxID=2944811 RepID=A0ABT0YW03_9BURK|nr:hypothetical protein [Caldimonas mangrovi]MCM5682920.1 hypothetical protein [Caldimonas mangrovi]
MNSVKTLYSQTIDFPVITMADVAEREMIRAIFELVPIQPIAYVGTTDWYAALDNIDRAHMKALDAGFTDNDIDAITADMDDTCAEGLNAAADRLNAAVLLSVAMPHVTLKPEPVKTIKPAISGLTTVRGV